MALLFMDGFDKYGPVNTNVAGINSLLTQEWTTSTFSAGQLQIVNALSSTGFALLINGSGNALTKTLAASYGRLIGGFRFSASLAAAIGMQFMDGASSQCGFR